MPKIILAAIGRITTHFHEDIGRGFLHRGIDQGHGDGNAIDLQIKAPADGVVTFAGAFGSYGLVIFILHDDGWVSVLAHHKKQLVSKGDRVKQSQIIAVMGNTGTVYVHNHQELRDAAGNQVDPLLHLGTSSAAAEVVIPIEPIVIIKEDEMKVYANTEVPQAWVVGGAGIWRTIPSGYADDAMAAFGPVVKLSNRAFDLARKICNKEAYGS